MTITAAALEAALTGGWAVHGETQLLAAGSRFRRRPASHIAFRGHWWWLWQTSVRHRFGRCGLSQGSWQAATVGGRALLLCTVRAYRPSASSRTAAELSYGYGGGAGVVILTRERLKETAGRMRNGQASMYFLPLELSDREIVVALPSDGSSAPRQRWTRTGITWPPP